MLLIVVRRLLLGVRDVAVTCVRERVVFPPTSRRLHGSDTAQFATASSEARRVLFPFLGENVCRHRRAFDPLETCLVAG